MRRNNALLLEFAALFVQLAQMVELPSLALVLLGAAIYYLDYAT